MPSLSRTPRTLPLVYARLAAYGERITAEDVFDDLDEDQGFALDRGTIIVRRRADHLAYAVRVGKKRRTPFRILTNVEAIEWIRRMIDPCVTSRGWRLKAAIHNLRVQRKLVGYVDALLDAHVAIDVRAEALDGNKHYAKRMAPAEREQWMEERVIAAERQWTTQLHSLGERLRDALRLEARALWTVHYLLRQRARIRRNRDIQLLLPFAA